MPPDGRRHLKSSAPEAGLSVGKQVVRKQEKRCCDLVLLTRRSVHFLQPEGMERQINHDKSADHLAHTIHGPTHVRLKETDEGAHEALQIESNKGATTLLRFRSPVLPQSLDGVVLNR